MYTDQSTQHFFFSFSIIKISCDYTKKKLKIYFSFSDIGHSSFGSCQQPICQLRGDESTKKMYPESNPIPVLLLFLSIFIHAIATSETIENETKLFHYPNVYRNETIYDEFFGIKVSEKFYFFKKQKFITHTHTHT